MSQSVIDKIYNELQYWFDVAKYEREGPLTWKVTPNANWPKEHSFGFHFCRDCLSFRTVCKFRSIEGSGSYRLKFPKPFGKPNLKAQPMEAALWRRLTEE